VSVVNTATGPSSAGPVRAGRRRLPAVLAAIAVLLVVVEGGVLFWQQQPPQYSAMTTLVVLPAGNSAEAASYYDTLSRGQISTTFAEILALRATPEGKAKVTVEVVPETSLIQVTGTADTARAAESAADQALSRAEPYFNQLDSPYAVSVVQDAAGTAEHAGLTLGILSGVVAAVALIAAFAAYLAVRGLQHARAQARLVDGRLDPVRDGADAAAGSPAPGNQGAVNGARAPRDTKAARAATRAAQAVRQARGSREATSAWDARDSDGTTRGQDPGSNGGRGQRPAADPLPPQPAQ
jgi:capsular polysaccharide biosynthesis protein